jgi:hypothetical protein
MAFNTVWVLGCFRRFCWCEKPVLKKFWTNNICQNIRISFRSDVFLSHLKIPVSRCKLVLLEPGHSCSGPCFQFWAWVSVWEGFSLRKWSCPFVSLPYLLHLVVWFIHDLQLTPASTSSLHIRFRTFSNPITTLMYNYCNLVHPLLTNPHEPPVPQDVICKTKWNIWNKIKC